MSSQQPSQLSCSDFAAALAAREPVPGGGGTAALAAALGAALCSMAGAFTLGKKRYAAYEEDLSRMLLQAEEIRLRLLGLVDEDARGVRELMEVFDLPKDDPRRVAELERLMVAACGSPLAVMGEVARASLLLEEMGQKCSTLLVSDVGCGAQLCRAALEAASLNVLVNARALSDRERARDLVARCDALLDECLPRLERTASRVTETLRGGD